MYSGSDQLDLLQLLNDGHDDLVRTIFDQKIIKNVDVSTLPDKDAIIWMMVEKKIVRAPFLSDIINGNHFDIIKMMLERQLIKYNDADVYGCDKNNLLMVATINNQLDVVKILLTGGANPNSRNNFNVPVLSKAAVRGNIDIAKLLIDHGANLNGTNDNYTTALMHAIYYDKPEMVKFLLDLEIDMDVKENSGFTAMDYARGKPDIIKLLDEAKAKREASKQKFYKCANGKIYPELKSVLPICYAVFCLTETDILPETYTVTICQGVYNVEQWKNNKWVNSEVDMEPYQIQIPADTKIKLEYHVVTVGSEEFFVKFSKALVGNIYRN